MPLDPCIDDVKAALGRDETNPLTKEEKTAIVRHASKLKARIDAGGDPAKVLENFIAEREEAKEGRKSVVAMNQLAEAKANARLEAAGDFGTKAPGEVLKSIFVSSLKQFKGAYDSLGRSITRGAGAAQGAFLTALDKTGLTEYAFKGKDQLNIWKAFDALNKGQDPAQFGANAAAVAKILKDHTGHMWGLQKDALIPIGRNDDWAGPQMHDPYSIGRAGGNRLGSKEAADAYLADVMPRVNWNKTFGGELLGADPPLRLRRMRSLWEAYYTQKHLRYSGSDPMKGRDLFFNSVEDQYAYNLKYGGGRTLAENVFGWLGRSARAVEIAKIAGSDPESWVTRLSNEWGKRIDADESLTAEQAARAKKGLDQATKAAIRHWIPALTDSLGGPEHAVAQFAYNANSLINSLVVGAATPVLVGDIPLAMNQIARFGGKAAQGYINQFHKAIQFMSGLPKADRIKLAASAEIMLQDMTRPMMFANADNGVGRGVAKVDQGIMKLAGHTGWTDRVRTNGATVFGALHWFEKDKPYAKLDQAIQDSFERFGIGEKEWDIIRQQEATDVLSNVKAFGPAAIRRMDKSVFKSIAANDSDAALYKARTEVADKYRNFIGDMADRITTSPSEELRALTTLGTRPGSLPGMMVRMFNGLKSFTYNLTRNHYGAMIAGDRNPENLGFARLAMNFAKGAGGEPGGRVGMAKFAANNAAFGMLIYQLGLLRNGQQPLIPDTPERAADLLWRGFLRQGAGMYGELLFGQLSDPDKKTAEAIVSSFAPIVGDSADLFDATKRIAGAGAKYATQSDYGSDKFFKAFRGGSAQAARVFLPMVPGENLVWTKFATDWYFKDALLDAINPGYKERLTKRAAQQGTPYLLGPQEAGQ